MSREFKTIQSETRRGGKHDRHHVPPGRLTALPPDRAARLREAIAGLRGQEEREAIDLTPKSAHEAITRQMVADLAADLAEVKARVNAILWLVAGAVIVDVALRVAGVG